ncbi:hypothetical protein GDO81_019047 [Engystomops pustulosus]|uniref:Uncharacterized protein n=1 Tax=Engystomops pustulosus TaxID=76066 RepID=A0AAV6ZKE1_ENGPU|nr:hypothetical protein GDO81_019047 [Engystomops pustulosus]
MNGNLIAPECTTSDQVKVSTPQATHFPFLNAAVFPNTSGFRSATPPDFRRLHAGADAPQSDRVRHNPGAIQVQSAQIGNIRVTRRENAILALSK